MALKALLILFFVLIMAISSVEAQSLVGIVHVNGTLYCTPNGSPGANGNATPVFPNATLQVSCPPNVMAAGPLNATSNANGAYLAMLLPQPNATVDSIVANCHIFVLTPLSNCNPSLPSASLVSNLRFIKTVPVGFLTVTYMVPTGFTIQA